MTPKKLSPKDELDAFKDYLRQKRDTPARRRRITQSDIPLENQYTHAVALIDILQNQLEHKEIFIERLDVRILKTVMTRIGMEYSKMNKTDAEQAADFIVNEFRRYKLTLGERLAGRDV